MAGKEAGAHMVSTNGMLVWSTKRRSILHVILRLAPAPTTSRGARALCSSSTSFATAFCSAMGRRTFCGSKIIASSCATCAAPANSPLVAHSHELHHAGQLLQSVTQEHHRRTKPISFTCWA